MKRTRAIIVGAALAGLTTPAMAADWGAADTVIQRLISEGYTQIRIDRTWLGRIQIEARGAGGEREVIVNPRTGEILRDYLYRESDEDKGASNGQNSGDDDSDDDHNDHGGQGSDDDHSDDDHSDDEGDDSHDD